MKTKGYLICFIGMDGSGKTTLAKLVVDELKKNKIKCNYVYGRYKPILSKPILELGRALFLRGKDVRMYSDYSKTKKEVARKHKILALIYRNILFLDYYIQLFIKIIIPKKFGRVIVCDRYVYDTVINDIPMQGDGFNEVKRLIETCFRVAPKPDLVFLIDVPEEIAFQRKSDTPSIEYLRERRRMYLDIGEEYGIVILDGSKKLDELRREIGGMIFQ